LRRALVWYADRENYLDGVPYLKDDNDGLMGLEDNGSMARNALRREDASLGVLPYMPKEVRHVEAAEEDV
jgi:hypothetical protein